MQNKQSKYKLLANKLKNNNQIEDNVGLEKEGMNSLSHKLSVSGKAQRRFMSVRGHSGFRLGTKTHRI